MAFMELFHKAGVHGSPWFGSRVSATDEPGSPSHTDTAERNSLLARFRVLMSTDKGDIVRLGVGTWIALFALAFGPPITVGISLGAWVYNTGERVAVLETTQTYTIQRLQRIEGQLDVLLEREKGN